MTFKQESLIPKDVHLRYSGVTDDLSTVAIRSCEHQHANVTVLWTGRQGHEVERRVVVEAVVWWTTPLSSTVTIKQDITPQWNIIGQLSAR